MLDENDPAAPVAAPIDAPTPPVADAVDWKAQAIEAREALASRQAADARAEDKKRVAAKQAEEDEARKRGDFDRVLSTKEQELVALREANERYATAAQERLTAKVGRLPEAVQAKLALVRDALPIDKFEALVEAELGGTAPVDAAPLPPSPAVGSSGAPTGGDYQLHPETVGMLDDLYVPEHRRLIASKLGRFPVGGGDFKFRYQGTGDDRKDTLSTINLMNALSPGIDREARSEAHKRLFG